MNKAAIIHLANLEDTYAVSDTEMLIKIRVASGDLEATTLVYIDKYRHIFHDYQVWEECKMQKVASDGNYDFYEAIIPHEVQLIDYYFRLHEKERIVCYGNDKFFDEVDRDLESYYSVPNIKLDDLYRLPEWTKEAVVYQIFPDSFYRGDGVDYEGWYRDEPHPPEHHLGGTLQGIIDKLDHIESLGVSVIYMTPIFKSPPNHKYHISDFFEIDPRFGTKSQFKELVDTAHARGMRVLLDGVFHSVGLEFPYFKDVIEKRATSKYLDWFIVDGFPVQTEYPINYVAWGHLREMPNLNLNNPVVVEYLIQIVEYWVREFDIDGWRLDTVDKLSHSFLREMRHRMDLIKPGCIIGGELWYDARPWLKHGLLDTVMNYPFTRAAMGLFGVKSLTPSTFSNGLGKIRGQYPLQAWKGLWNLLSSHDIQRFLTEANDDVEAVKLAVLLQYTYPGTPFIYAGDEFGMVGHSLSCRCGLWWDEEKQNKEILEQYQLAGKLRSNYPVLSHGDFDELLVSDELGLYGFVRESDTEEMLVYLNIGNVSQKIELPNKMFDVLNGVDVTMGSIDVEPRKAAILHRQK